MIGHTYFDELVFSGATVVTPGTYSESVSATYPALIVDKQRPGLVVKLENELVI